MVLRVFLPALRGYIFTAKIAEVYAKFAERFLFPVSFSVLFSLRSLRLFFYISKSIYNPFYSVFKYYDIKIYKESKFIISQFHVC